MTTRRPLLLALLLLGPLAALGANGEPPRVVIESPLSGWTRIGAVSVTGLVEGAEPEGAATLVVNGLARPVRLVEGRFEEEAVLDAGPNEIAVLAGEGARADVRVWAAIGRRDLRIDLFPDGPRTGLSLRLTLPGGGTLDAAPPAPVLVESAPEGDYEVTVLRTGNTDAEAGRVVVDVGERLQRRAVLSRKGRSVTVMKLTRRNGRWQGR